MTEYQIQYVTYDEYQNIQSYDYKIVNCDSWKQAMKIGKDEKEDAVVQFFEGIEGNEDLVQVRVFPTSTEHMTQKL